eukprot:scaffold29799_cov70-Cyclotella_meneghiniana.AAC.5
MDLIRKLLVVDPCSRYTAAQALQSDWLEVDGDILANCDLDQRRTSMRASLGVIPKVFNWRRTSLAMSDISMGDS